MKRRSWSVVTICILIMLTAAVVGTGAITETEMSLIEAQQYYERHQYDKALTVYIDQLKTGVESGPLYFNVGNCCLQKGDSTGKAIYFYEMARRLIPRDTALLINLRYAKSLVKQANTVSAEPFMLGILRKAFDRFTLREAFAVWNICYFGCAILFVISLFVKRFKGLSRAIAVLFLCMFISMLISLRAKMVYEERMGVIVTPTADALLEPFKDSPSRFSLYEGMEVQVLKTTKQWHKIKHPDDKVGWIPKESLWRFQE